MNEEEMRYRVSAVVTSTLQIVVQARSAEEAEAFSDAIDFDKWSVLSTEYETVDVSKDFFESKNKVEQDADVTTSNQGPTLKIVKGQVLVMENNLAQKITAFATIIALPFALGAFLLTWAPAQQFYLSDPRGDGYVPPRNIEKLITNVQDSTVTIFCRPNDPKNKGGFGSGWAIDLENEQGKRFPTTLITNHHVIDECLDGKGKVTVLALFGKEYQAVIDNWDAENDLASIAAALDVPPLKLSEYEPFPGYWVAAIGSADGYEGSVAFGNVLNGTKLEILITAPLSRGNSGGPLVDNEGNVVGTNTFGQIDEQYNGAMSLNALCVKIMECEGDVFWKAEDQKNRTR